MQKVKKRLSRALRRCHDAN